MEFALLADHPEAVETVARWYFDEWGRAAGRSFDDELERVSTYTGRDTAPLIVLARRDGVAIGATQLKIREMEQFPEYEFWVGGVYVEASARGRGLASRLVEDVVARARAAAIDRLHLQTENLSGGLYARLGFEPLHEADSHGVRVVVMARDIGVRDIGRA